MINLDPVFPGYIIHCTDEGEWREVWETLIDAGFCTHNIPKWYGVERDDSVRIKFTRDGEISNIGHDSRKYYLSSVFNSYKHIEFSDLCVPGTSLGDMLSALNELL